MSNTPLVSILINNYNYARFLREAIDSALNQTYSHVEVIVVDDGSTDSSREVIESYGTQIISVFKKNGGQASAFNAGFKVSKGEIICFLDADDYYTLNKISKIVELFSQNSNIQWIFHELEDVDINGLSLKVNRNYKPISELSFVDFREKIQKGRSLPAMPATSALCFKANLLKQFLPMPEQLLISADNFLRLASICLKPGLLSPDKFAVHRIHGNNLFESRTDIDLIDADNNIKTCYYLRKLFPETKFYTNIIYANSVGKLAAKTNLAKVMQIPESRKYMQNFFSLKFGFTVFPRILYNYLKVMLTNFSFSQSL